jgi:hypothetical protein
LKKGVKVNGSINLNTLGYYAHGVEQRRDPFNWFATGSLNFNLFGYSAPFSFSYSNANKNFSQPFNQFSFAPQYKWIKTYIGYNAMTFSNYTLAGHIFLGGGVELAPDKWRISAMYGRLRKAVPFIPGDSSQNNNAAYERVGYGLKAGYEDNGNSIAVSLFVAKDDENSIPFVLPESQLTPKQNVAISINGRKAFLKHFFIDAEYAISALNNDIRANVNEGDTTNIRPTNNLVKELLPENSTSRYFDALNASLGYQGNGYSLQLRYERIAPEYQTLGAYYFNNDMRNITIVPSVRLFKNRLTLGGNIGFQQNNLDDTRASTTRRGVWALNAAYIPNEKWNFTGNHSNFSTFTNMKPQPDPFRQTTPLDTLNFYQVSQTSGVTVSRGLGTKENPQSILLSGSYQQANDQAEYANGNQQSKFVTVNMSYSCSFIPSDAALSVGANVYASNAAETETKYWGPTVNLTKGFSEKVWRASWTSSYNETTNNGIRSGPVLNNRLGLNYTPKKDDDSRGSHTVSLGLNVLNRLRSEQQPAFSEYTGTFNYSYSF